MRAPSPAPVPDLTRSRPTGPGRARFRPRPRLVAGAVVALALAGCASAPVSGVADGPPTDLGEIVDARTGGEVVVSMADNIYAPRALRVAPGATVTFRNDGANVHDATPVVEGAFGVVTVAPTDSATITVPTEPGTYRFYCSLHATPGTGLQRGAFVVG